MWAMLEEETYCEGTELCLQDFCKDRDWEKVVIRPSQVRRGD